VTRTDEPRTPAERPVLVGALLAFGLLAVLVLWFGRACWGGWWVLDRHTQPDTYLLGAIYERWAAQVGGGKLPLWFPEFCAGTPVHAAWMYGLFYPPLALFLALPPEAAWTWLAIVHVIFGALGMYAFLLRERRDAVAAASGALVFTTSGFVLGRVLCGHVNLVMPFAWAPWTLLAAARVVDGERGATAALGLCAGAGLLAGHVQIWFYVGPLVVAFAVFETARRRAGRTAIPRLLLGAAIALGVAAIQWAPAWELFVVSEHPPEARDAVASCSAPLSALASQIAPRFATGDERFAHEFLGLSGPLAVAAALFAFRLRDRRRWFWFVVLAVGLVMATGLRTAPGEFLSALPPFRWARTPARAMTLVVLAGSVLSAHGVADLFAGRPPTARALVPFAFLASALVFGVPGPDVVRSDFFDVDWTRALAGRDGRVVVDGVRHPFVEARGVRTLRAVCPYDAPGATALLAGDTPKSVQAWWFDVAAVVDAPWRDPPPDAAAVASAVSDLRISAPTHGGATQRFERASRVVSFDDALARLRAGDRGLWIDETTRDVEAAGPWVLRSEKWYPGWKAWNRDAGWTPVARGNLAFIAAPQSDADRVEYRPWWLAPALACSCFSLVAAVVIVVRARAPR